MLRNLAARNLSIPGSVFETPEAQAERFRDPGLGGGAFTHVGAKSLWQIRTEVVRDVELSRWVP
jgi:[phosphatase 2A protein]-leucine-carboxy methyltransferase